VWLVVTIKKHGRHYKGTGLLYIHPRYGNGPSCSRDVDPDREKCPACGVTYHKVPLTTKKQTRKRLGPSLLKEIFNRTVDEKGKGHCYLCWGEIRFESRGRRSDDAWEVDHVIPFSDGPIFDTCTNMLPAHG
jgi:hypothetical protein